MASVLSDDESEERSHPLTQERPGVYVQVVASRRRKARKSQQEVTPPEQAPQVEARPAHMAELVAADAPALGNILGSAIDAHPKANSEPPAPPAPESERPSGEREIVAEAPAGYVRSVSQNSNGRADGVVITLPPPPRVPTFLSHGLTQVEREFARTAAEPGPSVLDAPTSLQPAPTGANRVSWGVISFVAALSAIVASAVVVAFRGSDTSGEGASVEAAPEQMPSEQSAEMPRQPSPRSQPASAEPAAPVQPAAASPAPAAVSGAPDAPPATFRKLPVMGPSGVIAPPPSPAAAAAVNPQPRPGAGLASSPAAPRPAAAAAAAPAERRVAASAPSAEPVMAKPDVPPSAPPAASDAPAPSAPSELPDNPYAE